MKIKCTASDIVHEANSLTTRSDEILNVEARHNKKSVNTLAYITFVKVEAMMKTGSNIMGKISTYAIRIKSKQCLTLSLSTSLLYQQDKDNHQCDLTKLKSWAFNWLIKLNLDKCKKVSYGRHIEGTAHYSIDNVELENVESIKDLGVTFDSHLMFELHMSEKNNKAYSILGIIRRNFTFLGKYSFLVLYKSMVRSLLKYANFVWSPHLVQNKKI